MDKHDYSIHILDSIFIHLDQEDTLDDGVIDANSHVNDNEYDTIDVDHDFPNMLSKQLMINPTIEHS